VNQEVVDLSLAESLKASIGLVGQKNRTRVSVQLREEKQRLPQFSPGRRETEVTSVFVTVRHHDFAPLRDIAGRQAFNIKQRLDVPHQLVPVTALFVHLVAQVPKDLSRLALADEDPDFARLFHELEATRPPDLLREAIHHDADPDVVGLGGVLSTLSHTFAVARWPPTGTVISAASTIVVALSHVHVRAW